MLSRIALEWPDADDGTHDVQAGDPEVVICVDEFGPSTSSRTLAGSGPARPVGRPDAAASAASDLYPPAWPAHLLAAYDLSRDRLYGHIKPRKRRGEFLVFRISIWAAANNVE